MATLRIGTCSWKYDSWAGLVYSAAGGINFLEEYARRYDTVEVDQWFWSLFANDRVVLPDPRVVEEYAASVPPTFRFTVKAPNSVTLTHHHQKDKAAPPLQNPHFLSPRVFADFWERLKPMHPTLGPVMLQFEYLNRMKMPSAKAFVSRLEAFFEAVPKEVPLFVEVRNHNYFSEALFDLLVRRDVGFVLLQGYYMPPITDVVQRHRAFFDAQKTVVVRLHGPDRAGIEEKTARRWDQVVDPKTDELRAVTAMIAGLMVKGTDVFLNVNNHYEGSAPRTIETIRGMIKTL